MLKKGRYPRGKPGIEGEQNMIYEITTEENHLLVCLSGKIYMGEAARLREILLGFIDKGQNTFIIDLSGVEYMDSSGLGTLVAIQKRALQKGGGVIIKGLQGLVKELFELTRLIFVFEIQ